MLRLVRTVFGATVGGGGYFYMAAAVFLAFGVLGGWTLVERGRVLKLELVQAQAQAAMSKALADSLQDELKRLAQAEAVRAATLDALAKKLTITREAIAHAPDTRACAGSPAVRALRDSLRQTKP